MLLNRVALHLIFFLNLARCTILVNDWQIDTKQSVHFSFLSISGFFFFPLNYMFVNWENCTVHLIVLSKLSFILLSFFFAQPLYPWLKKGHRSQEQSQVRFKYKLGVGGGAGGSITVSSWCLYNYNMVSEPSMTLRITDGYYEINGIIKTFSPSVPTTLLLSFYLYMEYWFTHW